MPTLDWIGKKAVLNHHRQVPYRLLHDNPELSVGNPGSGSLLVQGDNLLALKALLPYYTGKVKCIYIDPPYNTGNENWVYNDAVNSPEMRNWLSKVVGAKAEDLFRHDKWLWHCQLKETVLKTLPLNVRFRACMGPCIPLRARKPLARDISLPPGGEISALPTLS